jgi:hypothetical protein
MRPRAFLRFTEAGERDIWIDADRIAVVRDTEGGALVYVDGVELPALVLESVDEIMDRLLETMMAREP